MKKLLFSIMLSVVFLIPFTTQAEIITVPVYKVDVTQPAEGIGLNKSVVANVVKSTERMRSLSQIKNIDLNIKMTSFERHCVMAISGVLCHSTVTDINGVPGGDSIGIRQFS